MKIYDAATNTSPVVGQYCEASKPQNFISSTNEILLYFKSDDNGQDKKGFQLKYKTSSEYLELYIKKGIIERNCKKSLRGWGLGGEGGGKFTIFEYLEYFWTWYHCC